MTGHKRETRQSFTDVLPWMMGTNLVLAETVARRIASRLQNAAEEPALSVSIGIALFPEDGRKAQELLFVADRARYLRKKEYKAGSKMDTAVRSRRG